MLRGRNIDVNRCRSAWVIDVLKIAGTGCCDDGARLSMRWQVQWDFDFRTIENWWRRRPNYAVADKMKIDHRDVGYVAIACVEEVHPWSLAVCPSRRLIISTCQDSSCSTLILVAIAGPTHGHAVLSSTQARSSVIDRSFGIGVPNVL